MITIIEGKGSQSKPVTIEGEPIIIEAGDILFSDAIIVPDHEDVGLSYRVHSSGIPNISIFLEECHVEPAENKDDPLCVQAEGGKAIVVGLIDTDQHHCAINPLPLKCFRFRIEELSNTAPKARIDLNVSCK